MKIKFGLYDANGDAITGATTLKCKVKRDADDYLLDWNDLTFKASGWTTLAAQMAEFDATNVPGEYEKSVDESGWDDGVYTVFVNYSTAQKQNGSDEVIVIDGKDLMGFWGRLYQLRNYKMNVIDATGVATLRNKDDSGDLATGQITDDGTTTVRSKWSW